MSTTLPLFWNLSSSDKKERLDASVKLVGALEKLQASFVPKELTPESEAEDEEEDGSDDGDSGKNEVDQLNLLNAGDVSYSIRRLVRGLASPRESSRLGFAVALTELLSRINTVTCSQILAFVLDASQTSGSMSGQEERDMLFARLFGLTAITQSGLLVRQQPLPSSGSAAPEASSLAGYTDVITHLLALGEKKSWLRESAWWALALAIGQLHTSTVTWKADALAKTLAAVFTENKAWTPEKVALAVKMQRLWPERDWRKLCAPTIKHGDVLHTGNMVALARILKDFEVDEDEDVPKGGGRTWKPQVHYVWDVLLDELLPVDDNQAFPRGSFQEFFRIVVDESFFASTASNERKYWGFEIVQKALPRIKASGLPVVFTKNFMRTWINHLSHNDRYLHKFAKQIATNIQAVVQKDPAIGFSFILQLTGVNGNQQFDKLTKTKTVESILTTMNVEGIQSYIDHLLTQVDETNEGDIQATNARRLWIIEQFASLIRNGAIPKDDSWIQLILDWLTVHGIFIVKRKSEKSSFRTLRSMPSPPFSDELRKKCRERLLSCIAELTQQATLVKTADDKTQKATGVASDGEFWVARVVGTIEKLEKDSKHVKMLIEFEEEERAVFRKAFEAARELKKVSGEQQEAAKGVELLLLSLLLRLYTVDDTEEVDTTSLEACIDGASKLFAPPMGLSNKSPKKESKAKTEENDSEEEPEPIDVLVDTIIGFLEKATAYMRTVGNQSFSFLSNVVKSSTIDLILAQLERRDSAELMVDSEDDMDVDEEDGTEDEESDSDEEEEESDQEHEEEDEELRRKITEALRANGIECADGASDEETEGEMDDEQMMAIDDQLAQIFKEQTKGKGRDDIQREATHFKNRILDLLDIFMKKQPTSPLILQLITPLLDLTRGSGSDEKQLSEKSGGLLKSRIGKLKDVPTDVDFTSAKEILDNLHARARKVHSSDALGVTSQCSLYVARILLQAEEEAVLNAYRASLVDFTERKASDLNAKFFEDFIKRHATAAWSLRTDLLAATGKAVNNYRQVQVYGLLQSLLNNTPSADDQRSDVLAFMASLRENVHAVITKACDESTLTATQLKDVFKVALSAARQTKRVAAKPGDLSKTWKPVLWADLQTRLMETERFKSSTPLHGMCKQMVQLTQESASPKKGRQTEKGEERRVVEEEKAVNGEGRKAKKGEKGGKSEDGSKTGKRKADAFVDDAPGSTKKVKRKKSPLGESY